MRKSNKKISILKSVHANKVFQKATNALFTFAFSRDIIFLDSNFVKEFLAFL